MAYARVIPNVACRNLSGKVGHIIASSKLKSVVSKLEKQNHPDLQNALYDGSFINSTAYKHIKLAGALNFQLNLSLEVLLLIDKWGVKNLKKSQNIHYHIELVIGKICDSKPISLSASNNDHIHTYNCIEL